MKDLEPSIFSLDTSTFPRNVLGRMLFAATVINSFKSENLSNGYEPGLLTDPLIEIVFRIFSGIGEKLTWSPSINLKSAL